MAIRTCPVCGFTDVDTMGRCVHCMTWFDEDEPVFDKKETVYASFDEALVAVVPAMKLTDGESVSFKVEGFPESIGVTEYRLTLKDMGGSDLYPNLENFFKGEWVASSRSLEVCLAIGFVRKARLSGFWMPS